MNKKENYFYMVWMSGDCDDTLSWFTVHATRRDAMDQARYDWRLQEGWKVKYLSAKSDENPWDYDGKKTLVVHQTSEYYHGA